VSRRILIVDDNEELGKIMGDILRLSGFTVSHSPDIRGAKELIAARGEPDLLILDYWLTEGTTVEFAISLKSTSPDTKIIMMSGEADEEEVRRIRKLVKDGVAIAYIAKPFSNADIEEVILALEDPDARGRPPAQPPPPGR
jgi:DNA-binding NtrC family response regulator